MTFDLIAVLLALLCGWLVYKWRFQKSLEHTAASIGTGYFLCLSLGSLGGSYLLGTLNLYISGTPMIGRSILGALFGAIIMVELYKLKNGTKGSTGYIYVIPFCVCIIIGRIGCFLSGLDDNTHGIETASHWGWDYGDGVLRHPVQLYESICMLFFAIIVVLILRSHSEVITRYGFYLCVCFYAAQRFLWEFLKPYGELVTTLNIFQCICLSLIVYSIFMIMKERNVFNRT